jgi:hypothetical protein
VPRNVVTVVRRKTILPRGTRRRERQDLVLARLGERYRVRWLPDGEGAEIDFPKRLGRRPAKDRVVNDLAEIEQDWRRLFKVYPTESSLGRHRRG